MEHAVDHDIQIDETEAAAPSLNHSEDSIPAARNVFKPLFFGALALSLVLAGACAWLVSGQQAAVVREGDLTRQTTRLEQQVADLQSASAQQQEELAQAQETIDLLEEYSVALPDGTVPD